MNEDLTPKELELIARVRKEASVSSPDWLPERRVPILKRFLPKRAPGKKRVNWLIALGVAVVTLGILATLAFNIIMISMMAQLGSFSAAADLTVGAPNAEQLNEMLLQSGFEWYIQFQEVYRQRGLITGAILTGTVLIGAVPFAVNILKDKKV